MMLHDTLADGDAEDTSADGDAEITLMIAVTQTLSSYLRYIPVSAAELPGLVRDVARRVAPQVPPGADQIPASHKKPRRRREGSAGKGLKLKQAEAATPVVDVDVANAHKAQVADDAIDLANVRITRLPARRARGL